LHIPEQGPAGTVEAFKSGVTYQKHRGTEKKKKKDRGAEEEKYGKNKPFQVNTPPHGSKEALIYYNKRH
jgi:hypothetical protein